MQAAGLAVLAKPWVSRSKLWLAAKTPRRRPLLLAEPGCLAEWPEAMTRLGSVDALEAHSLAAGALAS